MCMQGKSLTAGDLLEAVGIGATTQKGRRAKELPGERRGTERRLTCLGDVTLGRVRTAPKTSEGQQ